MKRISLSAVMAAAAAAFFLSACHAGGGNPSQSEAISQQSQSGISGQLSQDEAGQPSQRKDGRSSQEEAGHPSSVFGHPDDDVHADTDGSAAEDNKAPLPGEDEPQDTSDGMHVRVLENLGLGTDGSLLSDDFYKAGDIAISVRAYLSDGDLSSSSLLCWFQKSEGAVGTSGNTNSMIEIETVPGKTSYQGIVKDSDENETGTCQITFQTDGTAERRLASILVEENDELAGTYYSLDSYDYPEVFSRYLSKADLCFYPTEDLWLLRNEIYAAHGRAFTNEILSRYFSGKSWYQPRVQPSDFSDQVLSDIEKKNILLIQSLEQDPERNQIDHTSYGMEDIPPAPYRSYLTRDRETGLRLDFSDYSDMGAYYSVHGKIYYPVAVTQAELDRAENGGLAEVTVDELTGEKWVFQLNTRPQDSRYSRYLLSEVADNAEETGREVFISRNYQTGLYELWQDSDDTIMKPVYEGEIYLMKGAVNGSHVSLMEASRIQKEIIPGDSGYIDNAIYGNYVSCNERGAVTAVYYLGD